MTPSSRLRGHGQLESKIALRRRPLGCGHKALQFCPNACRLARPHHGCCCRVRGSRGPSAPPALLLRAPDRLRFRWWGVVTPTGLPRPGDPKFCEGEPPGPTKMPAARIRAAGTLFSSSAGAGPGWCSLSSLVLDPAGQHSIRPPLEALQYGWALPQVPAHLHPHKNWSARQRDE